MRGNARDAVRRAYLGAVRGIMHMVSDAPKMQTVDAQLLHNELLTGVERFQPYGHTSVPLPPDQDGKAAEMLVVFLNGNRSHPVAVAVDDRRYRPKNLKHGESARYDDQKQLLHLARDGYRATAKDHVLTAGDKPDTSAFELNEQMKGLGARMAQAEHNLHGLFDVTSRFREIVQQTIPAVAEVAPILNQDPSGLPVMAQAIAGKEMSYLQQQVEQALDKFLSPNLAGLASLLSGGLESSITSLTSQIADLVAQNPVVSQVDDLAQELADLGASGAPAGVISRGTAALQAQIDALTGANPIVGTVSGLRGTLQGLIGQAGEALNFLAPQQRMVQGITRSLHLTKTA